MTSLLTHTLPPQTQSPAKAHSPANTHSTHTHAQPSYTPSKATQDTQGRNSGKQEACVHLTCHTGTHTVHKHFNHFRDTLKSHLATTHRHTAPPDSTLEYPLCMHTPQACTLDIHDVYTVHISPMQTPVTNTPYALPTDTLHNPNIQRRLKIPRLPKAVHTHRTQCTEKHTICVCTICVCGHTRGSKAVISNCS